MLLSSFYITFATKIQALRVMNYRKIIILLIFSFLLPTLLSAQGMQRKVSFMVIDNEDNSPLTDFTATLMTSDSTIVRTMVQKRDTTQVIWGWGYASIPFTGKGKFILKITSLGYETLFTDFEVKSNRQAEINLRTLRMTSEINMLDEVTVTGTKIKMVLKGDTVVYNADAFRLAEGSMLDALIAKFPGAEMNNDGEIKINGRKIESLLVDGKDFFAGDPKAALKNLPAYTVNKVKVFDRDGKNTEMMGRDMGDRQYVMDVRLKKEYQKGIMGNFRIGGGTDNRFLVDGMLRMSHGKSTLGITARANNVNTVDLPEGIPMTSQMIQSLSTPSGVNTNRSYGLSFSHGEFRDPFFITLSSTLSHNNAMNESWTSSQTYLKGGDTYGRSSNSSGNRNINWNNNILFIASPKGLNYHGNISFGHTSAKSLGNSMSANFDQDPSTYTDILQEVFVHPEKYRALTLNMQKTANESLSHGNSGNALITGNIKVGSDMITTAMTMSHSHSHNDRFSLNDFRYPKTDMRDFRHEYTQAPSNSTSINTKAGFNYALGRHSIQADYDFSYNYNSNENMLYRLDRLAQDDSTTLDMLPSAREVIKNVIDNANSYNYDSRSYTHQIGLTLKWIPIENKKQIAGTGFKPTSGDLTFELSLPLEWEKRDMNYFRQKASRVDQHNLFFNPQLRINYRLNNSDRMTFLLLHADINTSAPDMLSLIDFRDDSNPLNVRLGNPDLKNSRMYHLNVVANNIWNKSKTNLNFSANYSRSDNQMAYSMVYDKETGVQTTRPVNVNGNWNAGVNISFGRGEGIMMGKKDVLSFKNDISYNYRHSVDMTSVAGMSESQENTVNNSSINDNLSVTCKVGADSEVSLHASGTYNHTTGNRTDFQTIHAGDYSFGASATLSLPWKFELTTDLTNFSHRGYSASEMNTDQLVWNATLNKSLMKGALVFSLRGADLLGQLKNQQFTVNEQGRTETFNNVIPRYVMLSATYRFNKMPKKKNNGGIQIFGW